MPKILIINGPNLNRLGTRQPDVYGTATLADVETRSRQTAEAAGYELDTFQSNHEGHLIDAIQEHDADGIVINAGALTHYSYALHDAIVDADVPTVEVHISDVKERESWRAESVIGPACVYTIYGRGIDGYTDAINHLIAQLDIPAITIPYGPGPDQRGDLRVPNASSPVMVFIHGGFWRKQWTRDLMDRLAVDATRVGWATWNIEYRRLGTGGGWPVTAFDVAQAIDHLADLQPTYQLNLSRVVLVGHSAGGQLALWAGSRNTRSPQSLGADPLVRATDVIALAAVSDLLEARSFSDGVVDRFLATAQTHTEVYRSASPIDSLPLGVNQILAHGTADEAVPVEQSQSYSRAARQSGDTVIYHEFDGVDHMSLIDPASEAWQTVIAALS